MKYFVFLIMLLVSFSAHAKDPTITVTKDPHWYSNNSTVTIITGDKKVLLLRSSYRAKDEIIILNPNQKYDYGYPEYYNGITYRVLDENFNIIISKTVCDSCNE